MDKRVLVAYFSATGTTEQVARSIARTLGAELCPIRPQTVYSADDLNWRNTKSRSSVEMSDETCRPALDRIVPESSTFDVLILGFPIWWGVEPRVVDSFLDSINLEGKRIIAFATSGSSDTTEAFEHLKSCYPDIHIEEVKLLNSVNPELWVKTLGL